MDPLPLIPENHTNHEVAPILRTALQDTLDGEIYPRNVAEQFVRDIADEETPFRTNAKKVLEIRRCEQEDEIIEYILYDCPTLSSNRNTAFGEYWQTPAYIREASLGYVINYIKSKEKLHP